MVQHVLAKLRAKWYDIITYSLVGHKINRNREIRVDLKEHVKHVTLELEFELIIIELPSFLRGEKSRGMLTKTKGLTQNRCRGTQEKSIYR